MRITHNMLTRNYLKRMNTNLKNLTHSNEKMSSQRAFLKGYENVADAGKALKLRKLVTDNDRYQTRVRDAMGRASAAEDGLRTVNSLLIRAEDRLVEGLNGTMSPQDRDKIATELERLQEEVFQIMNNTYSDQFLYASAGNREGTAPFTIDDAGDLFYNGTKVDDMVGHPVTGKPSLFTGDPNDPAEVADPAFYENIPYNAENFVDIGFGYTLQDGRVNPNTGFKDSYSGVESFGFGTDENGVPRNVHSLFGKMVADLRADNMDGVEDALNALPKTMEFLLTSITEMGAGYTMLEDTKNSLESEYIILAEAQNNVEGIDLAEEIIYNKDYEMSWLVTLQLGSKILPQTIFDFIR